MSWARSGAEGMHIPSTEQGGISRRKLISAGIVGGAGLILSGERVEAAPSAGEPPTNASQPFTFVHLTDQHVTDRRHGHEGYRKCIEALDALQPAPDFVLMGGDMV